MARASTSIVKRIVYENLGITNHSVAYGTLLTNERYPTGYIDDAIVQADIMISTLLLKNKQNLLMLESVQELAGNSPLTVDNKWFIIKVEVYTSNLIDQRKRAEEVDFDTWERLNDDSANIYDATLSKGYYALKDGILYVIPNETYSGNTVVVSYIDLTHQSTLTTLQSPSGFESIVANLASSILLMKRGDKPEQSQFYMGLFKEEISQYITQDLNVVDMIDE